jgi:hypothetical protein
VGTSFTEYRGLGFWTRDAALETVLALLVLELEPLARLPAAGLIEVTSPDLARRAERVCEGHGWYVPGALATWTGHVADTLHDLVAGHLPPPSGGFWFVDGDGRRLRPVRRP